MILRSWLLHRIHGRRVTADALLLFSLLASLADWFIQGQSGLRRRHAKKRAATR